MGSIRLMLLEGFQDDEVVVVIDGLEIDRRSAVSSSLLLGMADEVSFVVSAGARELEVSVPTRGLLARARLPEGDSTFLASVESGELVLAQGTGLEGTM